MSLKIPAEFTGLEKSAEIAAKKAGRNLKINLGTSARSVDALSQPLGRITGKADEFTKSMEAANARVLAFGASVGVLTAVTQAFKDIVTVTIQVEKQMASINAILGASSGELSKFKKEIFDVARNTEQSFETVSTAALELSRQGLSATEVVKRLNDSLILSRLSGQSAADAVAGLTSAINGFKKAGITSSEVVNKFSEAAKSAAVSERDLAEAFKRAGAVAGQAGVSFDELVGIVSAVQEKTSRGGAVIGNSFKTIFTRIQSLDKLKTMRELGVQIEDSGGQVLSATEIIKNLAGVLETFPDARRLQIAENLVGKFQVAPFISILEDYNDETSKAIKITEISAKATTAAYERNDALNKTLSASINQVTVNLSELADMLGKIGVTDSLQNVLGFFNSMVEGLKGLLDEDTGSNIAKGLVKGIGAVLSGPGLAVFAAVIGKLTLDLVKFGTGSLKTFFGLNRAAKEQATLQGQIASTLLNNKGIQEAILKIERSSASAEEKKAQQTKFFTTALNEQLAVMQRMQNIAARVAPGVRAGTRGRGAFGRGAGGYVPNFAGGSVVGSEQADINRGVGGAPPSARPVSIPNFNFGGGQRGTMVANTSEFIVPNFGGGSAIFNQNMASSMGLPPGARRVGAARGYIPNFAISSGRGKSGPYTGIGDSQTYSDFFKKGVATSRTQATLDYTGKDAAILKAQEKLRAMKQQKSSAKLFDADKRQYALLTMRGSGSPQKFTHSFRDPFMGFSSFSGTAYSIRKDGREMGKYSKMTQLEEKLDNSLAKAANKVVTSVAPLQTMPRAPITASNIDQLIADEGGAGALEAVKGALFESITNAVIGGVKNDSRGRLDIAFNRTNTEPLSAIFGINKKYKFGDYKASIASKDKFVRQAIKHSGAKAASGYIPNYAGPLEGAVMREASAGVPINQIRINQKGTLRNSKNPMGLAVTNTRDEPTGAIPSFAKTMVPKTKPGSGSELEKPTRDLLGTIFAVQMGVSLLAGATSDAEKGIGKFVNTLTTGISDLTTGLLAGSALKSFADGMKNSTGVMAKLTRGAGTLAIALGTVSAVYKVGTGIYKDLNGVNEANKDAMALLTDAAKGAALALNELSAVDKNEVQTLVDSISKGTFTFGAMLAGSQEAVAAQAQRFFLSGGTQAQFAELAKGAGAVPSAMGGIPGLDKQFLAFPDADSFREFGNKIALEISKREDTIKDFAESLTDKQREDLALYFQDQVRARRITREEGPFASGAVAMRTPEMTEIFKELRKSLGFGGGDQPPTKAARDMNAFIIKNLLEDMVRGLNVSPAGLSPTDKGRAPIETAFQNINEIVREIKTRQLTPSAAERRIAEGSVFGNVPESELSALRKTVETEKTREAAVLKFVGTVEELIKKSNELSVPIDGLVKMGIALRSLKFEDISLGGEFSPDMARAKLGEILGQEGLNFVKIKALTETQISLSNDLLDSKIKQSEQDLFIKNLIEQQTEALKASGSAAKQAGAAANDLLNKLRSGALELDSKRGTAFDRIRGKSRLDSAPKMMAALKVAEKTNDFTLVNQLDQADRLSMTLIDASETFTNNIADGLVDAIVQGKSLKETLVSAATDFFTILARAQMKAAADSIVSGGGGGGIFGFLGDLFQRNASGGMISGGSGVRDDVPALLTGGEFVMRKSSVQKYGSNFMSSLNQGSVPKFANGGMFIPGTYGQGAISGKQNLLNFATQTGTSGAFDRFGGGAGFASIALAPESLSLTNLGRSLSPAFKRTQGAKADAFDLYVQQLNADKQRKEQERQLAQAKKDRRRGLFAALGLAAGGALLQGAFGAGGIFGGRKTSGLESNVTAADLGGRSASALPPGLGIDTHTATSLKGPQISLPGILKKIKNFLPPLPSFFEGGRTASDALFNDQGGADPFHHKPFIGPLEEAIHMRPHMRPMGGMIPYMAGGGGVPYAAGVDTVPAMLSGGEFVMNAGATQRIGAGNLETLNAGGNVGGGSSTSITKGDTNISIVVNSDGGEKENNSGSADQQDQNLAVKLKDAVRDVLSQEKRLGGMLRV
jgi:TP901 family phage tail tape measure protein